MCLCSLFLLNKNNKLIWFAPKIIKDKHDVSLAKSLNDKTELIGFIDKYLSPFNVWINLSLHLSEWSCIQNIFCKPQVYFSPLIQGIPQFIKIIFPQKHVKLNIFPCLQNKNYVMKYKALFILPPPFVWRASRPLNPR